MSVGEDFSGASVNASDAIGEPCGTTTRRFQPDAGADLMPQG